MNKKIEGTGTQAEQTTALAKYRPSVLNGGKGIVGAFRGAVDFAVYAFSSVAFCAIAIALASMLTTGAYVSERTFLLNLYTFAFAFGACCATKAFRIARTMFGKRSE